MNPRDTQRCHGFGFCIIIPQQRTWLRFYLQFSYTWRRKDIIIMKKKLEKNIVKRVEENWKKLTVILVLFLVLVVYSIIFAHSFLVMVVPFKYIFILFLMHEQ